MDNDVYYKIFLTRDDLVTIVCMQWFDENDYDHSRFYRVAGEEAKFMTEEHAKHFLNQNFKPECIDPEYLDYNEQPNYLFKDKLKD